MKHNVNLIRNILTEIGINSSSGNKIELKDSTLGVKQVDPSSFKPYADIISFMNEKHCIDTLCTAILFENNEVLLENDEINANNIDSNLRITDINTNNIKQGILYDVINGNKTLEDFNNVDIALNNITENSLSFNDIMAYWEENNTIQDNIIYQDYADNTKSTINKEQDFLIKKYIGNRKNRRDKLGRATEFIDYCFEVSTSFRIMREFKRHRIGSFLYPKVISTKNSFGNYIFPDLIVKNTHLFNEYKYLIVQSFNFV